MMQNMRLAPLNLRFSSMARLPTAVPSHRDLSLLFKLYDDPVVKLGPRPIVPDGHAGRNRSGRNGGTQFPLPLFVVHGNFGNMRELFRPLAARLNCESFAFQFGKYSELDSIHELAKAYVRELWLLQSEGPYNICGYSGGGTVAFEMVQILQQEYKAEISNLIFLDGSCDWTKRGSKTTDVFSTALNSSNMFSGMSEQDKKEFLRSIIAGGAGEDKIEKVAGLLCRTLGISSENPNDQDSVQGLKHCMELYLRHHLRTFSFVPSAQFHGRATLIRATANQFFDDATYHLQKHCCGPLSCHVVSGNHTTFLAEKFVDETAGILNRILLPGETSQ